MSTPPTASDGDKIKVKGVSPLSIFYSFVPYILMSLFASNNTFLLVTSISFLMSAAWMVYGLATKRGLHQLSTVGTVVFGVMLIAAIVDPGVDTWMREWSGTVAEIALVLTSFIGILVKRPFTLYYAKLADPVQWEHNPEYRAGVIRISQIITAVWGISFAITALCDFLPDGVLFGWIIPLAALFGAVRFTMWYPNYMREKKLSENPELVEQHRQIAQQAAAAESHNDGRPPSTGGTATS